MAKKSVVIYDSWGVMAGSLPDDQSGKLFKAICKYGFEGEEPVIDDPAINAMFAMIRKKLDEDAISYQEKADRMRKNRTDNHQNGSMSDRSQTDICQKSDRSLAEVCQISDRNQTEVCGVSVSVSVSDKDIKESKERKVKTPTPIETIDASPLSDPVKEKLKEWVSYKTERREGYKPTGLKALITAVRHHEETDGVEAVIKLIDECMANGWKGLIWDRLNQQKPRSPDKLTQMHNYGQRQYDFSSLEKQLVKNA